MRDYLRLKVDSAVGVTMHDEAEVELMGKAEMGLSGVGTD